MNPRVFTIPASAPFLPTLIEALNAGKLGFAAAGDRWRSPRQRSTCRRDALAVCCAMLSSSTPGGDAAILPRIVAIGDIDEDEIAFAEAAPGKLPPKLWRCHQHLARSKGGCSSHGSSPNGLNLPSFTV